MVGVIATIAGVVLFLTIDELRNFSISVLIVGLSLLFAALVLSPRAVAIFMAGRQGRYGVNVAIMTVAFFAIIILINFLMYLSPQRIDVTATRVFTLSQQTVNVLDSLEGPSAPTLSSSPPTIRPPWRDSRRKTCSTSSPEAAETSPTAS